MALSVWLAGKSDSCLQDEEEVARLADRMRHLLAPFVLRRLKSEVAGQLTAKQHRTEQVSMTEAQGDLYRQAFSDIRKEATAAGGCSWRVLCQGHPLGA